jgi:SAM-dependent methyltransferase
MPQPAGAFDARTVCGEWDAAADAYAEAQAGGLDIYRLHVFGPAQIALCGEVAGCRLLDVGCGSGYFSREMAGRGALVTAVDLSPAMLAHARRLEHESPLGIDYREGDAARLADCIGDLRFDMATSCLALQDMPELPAVLAGIHRALRPGGRLVASIAHPCTDTPFRRWERDPAGGKRWLCIDRYFERGPLRYEWKDWSYPFTTTAQHATLEDWIGALLAAGFELRGLHEPRPDAAAIAAHPALEDAARLPYFLLLDLQRGTG